MEQKERPTVDGNNTSSNDLARQYRRHSLPKYGMASSLLQSILQKGASEWVCVEKYLHGLVREVEINAFATIHLESDGGGALEITATQNQLAGYKQNPFFPDELLHVVAEENLATAQLRNIQLIGFVQCDPRFDEREFQVMVRRGTRAWSRVADDWLESLRDGKV